MDGEVPASLVLPVLTVCLERPVQVTEDVEIDEGIFVEFTDPPLLNSCNAGSPSTLAALEAKSLPTEDDDPDAVESLWELVETVYGKEQTANCRKGEDKDFDARALVVRILAWRNFLNLDYPQ